MHPRIICLISICLFLSLPTSTNRFKKNDRTLTYVEVYFNNQIKHLNFISQTLLKAYLLGETKGAPPAIKNSHRILCLGHLFSPSGLHLAAILIFFFPFRFYKNKSYAFISTIKLILLFLILFLPKLYTLKRAAMLRIFIFLKNKSKLPLSDFHVFLFVYTLDLLFGTFRYSPLSYLLSFLFLGTIMSHQGQTYIRTLLWLGLAQALASSFLNTPYYVFSLFLNPLLSLVFTIIFPLILILLPFSNGHFCSELLQALLKMYNDLVLQSAKVCSLSPPIEIPLILLLCLLYVSFQKSAKKRAKIILALLLFFPNIVLN